MADNAASTSQEDDLSLPRAAVNKMIKEMIPMIRVSNDARELVLNCCTEFIHLIASEANEICNRQTKKTISPEHIILALESLGFPDYVKDVEGVYQQFKTQAQTRKKNNKMKNQGVSEEELLRQQQALFAQARAEQAHEEWLHLQQQQQQNPSSLGLPSSAPTALVSSGLFPQSHQSHGQLNSHVTNMGVPSGHQIPTANTSRQAAIVSNSSFATPQSVVQQQQQLQTKTHKIDSSVNVLASNTFLTSNGSSNNVIFEQNTDHSNT